jgi:hypothetical protein
MLTHTQYSSDSDTDKNLTENGIFDLVGLIVEGLHKGDTSLKIEQHELLLDEASDIPVTGSAKIIVIESEIEEQEDNVRILVTGAIIAEPDINQPFTFFCSLHRNASSPGLVLNSSSLWSVSIPYLNGLQEPPLLFHNSVFSFGIHTTDRFGAPYSLGVGRGFLTFGDTDKVRIH